MSTSFPTAKLSTKHLRLAVAAALLTLDYSGIWPWSYSD